MNVGTILGIIGATSGVLSFIAIIYYGGVWKGRVDGCLKQLMENEEKYPAGQLHLMCKTLWDVVVVDPLHAKPDLAERKSPWRLKEKGRSIIPASIKDDLDRLAECGPCQEDISNGWLVVKNLGLPRIETMAKENTILVQEAIALLSAYIDERITNLYGGNGASPA